MYVYLHTRMHSHTHINETHTENYSLSRRFWCSVHPAWVWCGSWFTRQGSESLVLFAFPGLLTRLLLPPWLLHSLRLSTLRLSMPSVPDEPHPYEKAHIIWLPFWGKIIPYFFRSLPWLVFVSVILSTKGSDPHCSSFYLYILCIYFRRIYPCVYYCPYPVAPHDY